MRNHILLSLAVLLAGGAEGRLAAQQRDSMRAPSDTAEAARLRAQIEQRFNDRVKQELNLNADQATKLRDTQERFGTRRRAMMQQQFERRRALDGQMRPGMPANADSVNKLMDGMRTGRAEMVRIDQDEDREMAGYLTPVQRAQFLQMRERLMQRVGEMRMERREGRGVERGGRMGAPAPRLRGGRRGRGI